MTPNDDAADTLKESFAQGRIILVDKPYQWTSFDVVNKMKALLRHRLGVKKIKIGHAGTLDPLATGLLIVCTGKATKQIETFQDLEKTYTGTFLLGQTTPSFDLETPANAHYPTEHLNEDLLQQAALELSGIQQQIPPLFSAKKINGERAYEFARKGEIRELLAKQVLIRFFGLTSIRLPQVDFEVVCSKGTYIRSLVRDFGEKCNSGATLTVLRRTAIGDYQVDDAMKVDDLNALFGPDSQQ